MRKLISEQMRRKKIKQKDLAARFMVNDRTIRKWLSGKCKLEEYMGICQILDLNVTVYGPEKEIIIKGHFELVSKQGNV